MAKRGAAPFWQQSDVLIEAVREKWRKAITLPTPEWVEQDVLDDLRMREAEASAELPGKGDGDG